MTKNEYIIKKIKEMPYGARGEIVGDKDLIRYTDQDCLLLFSLKSGRLKRICEVHAASNTFNMKSLEDIQTVMKKIVQEANKIDGKELNVYRTEYIIKEARYCEARTSEEAGLKFKEWIHNNQKGRRPFMTRTISVANKSIESRGDLESIGAIFIPDEDGD